MKRADEQPRQIFKSASVQIRQFAPLSTPLCFLVSITSAYAGGINGLPPIVVHPVHTFTTPVHFSAPDTGSGSQTGNKTGDHGNNTGNRSANNPIVSTGSQTGNNSGGTHSNARGSSTSVVTANSHLATGPRGSSSGAATPHAASSLPSGGYQLDLASKTANIVLGSNLFSSAPTVTINVGGTATTFTSGDKVTAAEYLAIQQALSSPNGQTLVLNQSGTADGGQFALNKVINANVTEIVVPKNVTALDFTSTSNSTLTINGGLTNFGSVIDVSKQGTAGLISATDITNEKGGVISSVLPSSLLSTIPNTVGSLDLSLSALNNLTNAGTISSSGALGLATA